MWKILDQFHGIDVSQVVWTGVTIECPEGHIFSSYSDDISTYCPICHITISINDAKIPDHILIQIELLF